MTDTIYTPHEMLDRAEARCHVLRAELIQIDTYIDALCAERDALCAEIDALCAERDICNSEISAAFSALASF